MESRSVKEILDDMKKLIDNKNIFCPYCDGSGCDFCKSGLLPEDFDRIEIMNPPRVVQEKEDD